MEFQPGDIAACHGRDWMSRTIRWGTASVLSPAGLRVGPSHVAVLFRWREEMHWGESTSCAKNPCVWRGQIVSGAQVHLPRHRIADYVDAGGRVDLYRLVPFARLTMSESRLLTRTLLNEIIEPGVNYDLGGALLSGARLFQLARFAPGANLEELFCSELVAAVVMRLNRMNHANPSLYNPAKLLRELVRTGKYVRVRTYQRAKGARRCPAHDACPNRIDS